MGICANCWRDKGENPLMCDVCEARLESDLEYLARNAADLEEYKINRAYAHVPGAGSRGVCASEPVRMGVWELLYDADGVEPVLRAYAKTLGVEDAPGDVGKLAHTIARYHVFVGKDLTRPIFTHPASPAYAKEVRRLAQRAANLLEPAVETQILGPCPNPACGIPLSTPVAADTVTCPRCHCTWTREYLERERSKRITGSEKKGTMPEIRALLASCGMPSKQATVRSWVHRGKIKAHGRNGAGKPLYYVSDLYRLLSGSPAKTYRNVWEELK